MLRTLATGCGVVCVGVLAGCGGSHSVPDAAHGYLYRYGNGEAFMQWHRHGQNVRGTINETTIACCIPIRPHLIDSQVTFEGTISGSNVFLHLSNGVRWDGTLHTYGVLISTEEPSGAPIGVRYRLASGADYNAAVSQTKAALQREKNG